MAKVPYASAIGSFMYAMVCTRPDIVYAVGIVSRYMSNLGKQHWEAVKWILRYLRRTADSALCFRQSDLSLQAILILTWLVIQTAERVLLDMCVLRVVQQLVGFLNYKR